MVRFIKGFNMANGNIITLYTMEENKRFINAINLSI